MTKSLFIAVFALISHQALLVAAGCNCEPFNRTCTHSCVQTMASCVSSCDTGDLDLCANKCFEVYWPIVKGPGNLESRSLLLERGTIPVRNAGRHETDEMNGDAGQDSQHAGNEHGDSPTGPQNELPIKVTSHTTLYTEPTQAPAPRPSETPAHEGGNKGDTSMASFTTKNGLTTAMITTLAVASAWLLTA